MRTVLATALRSRCATCSDSACQLGCIRHHRRYGRVRASADSWSGCGRGASWRAISTQLCAGVFLLFVAVRFLVLERLVLLHFLIVRAKVFQQVLVTERPDTRGGGPRLRQYLGVLDGHLH